LKRTGIGQKPIFDALIALWRLDLWTTDAFALIVSMSIMSALLDTAQIAELIGCTRAHVTDRLSKREDFPRPLINVSRKLRKWSAADVMAWAAGTQSRRRAMSAELSR
jgi:predicted DNA-binding transcriptional regulator AlpA